MKVTDFTKGALTVRRERRDMAKAGWEFVGEDGGKLWELEREGRYTHRIADVKIAACGKALWVKIEPRASPEHRPDAG